MVHPLIVKYGEARLPRYTSYPTAPAFSPAVGADVYGDWLAQIDGSEPASLYLHIPFCRSMCWYCGCHTAVTRQDRPVLEYLQTLGEEARLVSAKIPGLLRIGHIHFGGGTPTIMTPDAFLAVMAVLGQHFEIQPSGNIAVEIDPRTLTAEMAHALGEAGVNRASLGIQSFDPAVQLAINRVQSFGQTQDAAEMLRRAGIGSINFDLIYGLPHETAASCIATAEAAVKLRPDRFAVFGYAHIPSFKKHQRLIDEASLPKAEERNAQVEAITATLLAAGYAQIGLDHFALPEDELAVAYKSLRLRRNFQGYTADPCETLIGLGASSIGKLPMGYVQNEVSHGAYARRVKSGSLATVKGYRLTGEDRFRAALIERLMCDFQVDVSAVAQRYGFEPGIVLKNNTRLKTLEDDGVVTIDGGLIVVRQDFRFLVRAVAASFDAYLESRAGVHSKAA